MKPPRQLGLPFPAPADLAAADFLAAPSNAAARTWLDRPASWPAGRLALFGEAGVGKTHLLRLWARKSGAAILSGPALTGLPAQPATPFALDDADRLGDEAALLHLLNAAAEAGLAVLLAARAPPARWPVALADLASRLRAIPAVAVEPADDPLLAALLAKLLADRQLSVAQPVQEFLLARLPRTAAAVSVAAHRLDRLALAAGGRITLRLAADILAGFDIAAAPETETSAAARHPASGAGLP